MLGNAMAPERMAMVMAVLKSDDVVRCALCHTGLCLVVRANAMQMTTDGAVPCVVFCCLIGSALVLATA